MEEYKSAFRVFIGRHSGKPIEKRPMRRPLDVDVHAKHEEKSESKSVYREYNREFMLPKGTNPESIKSSLSKDGVLTVEAPLPAIEGEKLIPIAQN
uniref:SHSP domain-containing protein n=1 Tax=Timema tahoe TaxID=61484 RepID=A0A7R9NUM1_9NEOP|nr:unnamed protein product [Timema tahoe]